MYQIWGLHLEGEAGETGNVIFLLGQNDTSVSFCNNLVFISLKEKITPGVYGCPLLGGMSRSHPPRNRLRSYPLSPQEEEGRENSTVGSSPQHQKEAGAQASSNLSVARTTQNAE